MKNIILLTAALLIIMKMQSLSAFADNGVDIIYIGDSNSEGHFGGDLDTAFRSMTDPVSGRHLRVHTQATCGSRARTWLDGANNDCTMYVCGINKQPCTHYCGSDNKACVHQGKFDGRSPRIEELFSSVGTPKLTVVALGVNMLKAKDSGSFELGRKSMLEDARKLIQSIHHAGSACLWVGPPQVGSLFVTADDFNEFNHKLQQVVEQNDCEYIRSDDKTDRRNLGNGGLTKEEHYGEADAHRWASAVLAELRPKISQHLSASSQELINPKGNVVTNGSGIVKKSPGLGSGQDTDSSGNFKVQ